MTRLFATCLPLLALAACASPIDAPSLDYRPAEAIDPRLPVEPTEPDPGMLTLAAEIAALRTLASQGAAAFNAQEGETRSLVSGAGAPGSESWTAAQKSLSRLDAARAPTVRALANLDQLATGRLWRDAWVNPANRTALSAAADDVAAIDARQSAIIDELTGRLDP